ncbi:MAG: hypothetical protein LC098_01450 [Burkholderiales bacterium]|nr:hypothetical protein [Burkholderiales bacterium]
MNTPATSTADQRLIDEIIRQFFAVFDNRDGRRAALQDFTQLFAPGAIIASHSASRVARESPEAFVAPRLELLASGRLANFHEWETSHRTETVGSLAVRRSRYAKRGQMDGEPYVGEGTKHFQLARLDQGWQIVAMCWIDDATDGVVSA